MNRQPMYESISNAIGIAENSGLKNYNELLSPLAFDNHLVRFAYTSNMTYKSFIPSSIAQFEQ